MIARAIGRELDGQDFNILEEVTNPHNDVINSFTNLTPLQFFKVRHEIKVLRDPMYRLDDIFTYKPYDYILFNLDNHAIIVPDYFEYEEGSPLTDTSLLHSSYEAYQHAAGISKNNKIMQFAFLENLILVRPTHEHQKMNGTMIRSSYIFRENSKNSREINISYCYCCSTFDCACTLEQYEKYTTQDLTEDLTF